MARRRKSARRAPRRFARAARTATRTVRTKARRVYRGARSSGWLPLGMRDMALDFSVGAVTPAANNLVAQYTDPFLGWAGDYKDEVRTALIGVAVHKLGTGIIKDAGREMFRYAILSAGQETGAKFNIGTTNGAGSLSSGVVMA